MSYSQFTFRFCARFDRTNWCQSSRRCWRARRQRPAANCANALCLSSIWAEMAQSSLCPCWRTWSHRQPLECMDRWSALWTVLLPGSLAALPVSKWTFAKLKTNKIQLTTGGAKCIWSPKLFWQFFSYFRRWFRGLQVSEKEPLCPSIHRWCLQMGDQLET